MNKSIIPRIIAIVVALIVVIAFFLPIISVTDDYRSFLDGRSGKPFESVDLTYEQMKDMSLFTYARVYLQGGEEIFHSSFAGTFYGVLIFAVLLFALLTLLGALINKPVVSIVFDVLMAAAYYTVIWDFLNRGIMPDSNRVWGISYSLYYPCAAVILICSILMIVLKKKKQNDK